MATSFTMAGLQTASDVPLLIRSDTSSSERRISPAWTIAQLKTRLEPITGIPPSCQRLSLKLGSEPAQDIAAADEEATRIGAWPLQAYAELHVIDTRPPGARANFTDVSSVPKYEMPVAEYEQRADTVLAWKKAQRLGRFDPAAPAQAQEQVERARRAVAERDIAVGRRCRLLPDADHRRGTVRFVGPVPEIPAGAAAAAGGDGGEGVAWVGVELDEPTGKNDGSIQEQRYFTCAPKHGVFIHPERVEVGDYPVLDEFADENEDDEF